MQILGSDLKEPRKPKAFQVHGWFLQYLASEMIGAHQVTVMINRQKQAAAGIVCALRGQDAMRAVANSEQALAERARQRLHDGLKELLRETRLVQLFGRKLDSSERGSLSIVDRHGKCLSSIAAVLARGAIGWS
jgi:hypothetical protein